MKSSKQFRVLNPASEISRKPVSVGSGLVALDWLLVGKDRVRPNEMYAGGSCGNVMAILAYLGWESFPVARLAKDRPAEQLLADLHQFQVRTDFVLREDSGSTPVIIVRVRECPDGSVVSRFEWRHPQSGDWLPRYRPVPKSTALRLADRLPLSNVFYFDRAEPSSLVLATQMQQRGATVIFEPSSTANAHLFSKCLAVSDIVKYSIERFPATLENPACRSPRLEIQTLGSDGLRFRLKTIRNTPGRWKSLSGFDVQDVRDTTGCGDWCSAGIIHELCAEGRDAFLSLSSDRITKGLQFGQALAAVKCSFLGARGPMYKLTPAEFRNVTLNRLETASI